MSKKNTILLVGPTPPLIGGISTQLSNLVNSKLEKYTFVVFTTNKKSNFDNNFNGKCHIFYIHHYFKKKVEQYAFLMYHLLLFPIVLLKEKPEIIHIHTPSYLGFLESSIYVLISKILQKKVILHIHGGAFDSFYKKSSRIMKYYIKDVLILSTRLITLSNKWKNIFVNEIGIKDNSIAVVHNGYDSSLFYPIDKAMCRKSLNLPADKKIILSVGDLIEIKGHKYLIESIPEVLKHRTDIICLIIGEGKQKNKLLKQIELAEMSNYVKLVGKKRHDEIPLWMNAADIFVLPSLKEGNPTVMLEALGTGLPFIGTKVGSIPEIIVSKEYGLLVDTNSSIDLKLNIIYALNKKWDRDKIATYSKLFTIERVAESISLIYDELLIKN